LARPAWSAEFVECVVNLAAPPGRSLDGPGKNLFIRPTADFSARRWPEDVPLSAPRRANRPIQNRRPHHLKMIEIVKILGTIDQPR
jgi:hypothetical protein